MSFFFIPSVSTLLSLPGSFTDVVLPHNFLNISICWHLSRVELRELQILIDIDFECSCREQVLIEGVSEEPSSHAKCPFVGSDFLIKLWNWLSKSLEKCVSSDNQSDEAHLRESDKLGSKLTSRTRWEFSSRDINLGGFKFNILLELQEVAFVRSRSAVQDFDRGYVSYSAARLSSTRLNIYLLPFFVVNNSYPTVLRRKVSILFFLTLVMSMMMRCFGFWVTGYRSGLLENLFWVSSVGGREHVLHDHIESHTANEEQNH